MNGIVKDELVGVAHRCSRDQRVTGAQITVPARESATRYLYPHAVTFKEMVSKCRSSRLRCKFQSISADELTR